MQFTALRKTLAFLALALCWGSLAPLAAAQDADGRWDVVAIIAPPQTVVVETSRGSYTARFVNEALVYANGKARGGLVVPTPGGTPRRFRVFAGRVQFDDGVVARVVLRLRDADPTTYPNDEMTIILRPPSTAAGEDCLIYTTIGTDVKWVAHGHIAVIRD